MENASKALIFAASTLLAIILLSLLVYIFRRFGTASKDVESKWLDEEIKTFNAKFSSYDTGGTYSLNDRVSFTKVATANSSNTTESYKYSDIFLNAVPTDYYSRLLVSASQKLNTAYDVVTAVNDAISINDKNNNSYKYGKLELQNSVEIIIDLKEYKNSFSFNPNNFQYFIIEPNKSVKNKCVYGAHSINIIGTNENNKKLNSELPIFNDSNEVNLYGMLDELRDTKVVWLNNKSYTVYKYYFFGRTFTNETTGKIETVYFSLVKDKNF